MSEPYIGEIRMLGFIFPPLGWALCDGATLPVSQHPSLFSIIGTSYGGDGQTNFKLPDLRGRTPIQTEQTGNRKHLPGSTGGAETVELTLSELPQHSHHVNATTEIATQRSPNSDEILGTINGKKALYHDTSGAQALSADTISMAGNNQGHDNMQPYLVISYCIALNGIFPDRS